jgi:hypothetical protein
MRSNRSVAPCPVIPVLQYPDPGVAAEWLSKAFGFTVRLGQYDAEDFHGHRWNFTETIADVEPESWGGTSVNL